jgi:hypothetical protein
MLAQRRSSPDQWFRPLRGRPRRMGLIGAVLALAVQLAIGFAPMPQMAGNGRDMLCLPVGPAKSKPDGRPGPLAQHECPICQVLQQTAACLAPAAVEIAPLPWLPRGPDAIAATARPGRPVAGHAQPRAPPSIA